jgi:hypothetical protein
VARAWLEGLVTGAELGDVAVANEEPVDVLEVDLVKRLEVFHHVLHVSFQWFVLFFIWLPFFFTRARLDSESKLRVAIDDKVLH